MNLYERVISNISNQEQRTQASGRCSFFGDLIIGATIALFAVPIGLDVALNGWKRTFSYFSADAFYYLTVARNFALCGFFTFDQELPTNGFHPLWQVLLGLLYRGAAVLSLPEPAILTLVLVINVVFIGLAIWLLGKCFLIANHRLTPVFLLLPAGVYAFVVSPIYPRYGSLWSYANGMESGLTILLYAILMLVMIKPGFVETVPSSLFTGVLLGLIFLSRLDYAFMTVALFVALVVRSILHRDMRRLKLSVIVATPVLIVLIAYLLSNLWSVGTLMPVSGTLKSTFPSPRAGISKVGDIISLLRDPSQAWAAHRLWRHAQIVIPMAVAVAFLIWSAVLLASKEWNLGQLDFALGVTGLFVLLLGLYNFLFVPLWDQGHWYFPISVLFVSLFVFHLLDRWSVFNRLQSSPIVVVTMAVVVIAFFAGVYRSDSYNQHYAWFFDEAVAIRQYYVSADPKLIEFDDGIIAYSTGFPTMSGLGFTLDKEALESKRQRSLLSLAYTRGYSLIASFNYFGTGGLSYDTPSEVLRQRLSDSFFLCPEEVAPFTFAVDYLSAEGRFAIIRMTECR